MKNKVTLILLGVFLAILSATAGARDNIRFSVSIDALGYAYGPPVPGYVYPLPPPRVVYYAPPAPVYYAPPAPVYYAAPAPVYYAAPAAVYYAPVPWTPRGYAVHHRGWHRHWR